MKKLESWHGWHNSQVSHTLHKTEGNEWLQNCVGSSEEPGARLFAEGKFYKSHYLIWVLDAEMQLSSMWLRNARDSV